MSKPTLNIIHKVSTKDASISYLYMQFTYFRKPEKFSLKKQIKTSDWKTSRQGWTKNRALNNWLNRKIDIGYEIIDDFEKRNEFISFQVFKSEFKKRSISMSDAINVYSEWKILNVRELSLGNIKKSTFNQRESHRKSWMEFKKKFLNINQVDENFLNRFVIYRREKGKKDSTIAADLRAMNTFMIYAIKKNLIKKNPISEYQKEFNKRLRKQSKNKKNHLTNSERESIRAWYVENADSLIPKMRERLRIFLVMCYTGLSYSDTQNITYEDIREVEHEGVKWKVFYDNRQKNNSIYRTVIPPNILDIIYEKFIQGQTKATDKIFMTLDLSFFNRSLPKLLKPIGITKKLSTHSGRHTFGMLTLEQGIGKDVLKDMLGHQDIRQTDIYAHRTLTGIVANVANRWKNDDKQINYIDLDFNVEKQIIMNIIKCRKIIGLDIERFYKNYAPQKHHTAVIERYNTKGYNFTLSIIEVAGIARNLGISFVDLVTGKNLEIIKKKEMS